MADKRARSVDSSGRFGARYGRVARRRVKEIEAEMRNSKVDGDDVTRVETGVWKSEETGEIFTDGTYHPQAPASKQVCRSIRAALTGEDE